MDRIVRIPVRVQSSAGDWARAEGNPVRKAPANHYQEDSGPLVEEELIQLAPVAPNARPKHEPEAPERGAHDEEVDWQDLALRLQAEMDNYRKRQQRLAQDQIESERLRLLRSFLPVVDDLERALEAPTGNIQGLLEGVQLTHRGILQRLQQEGVERIQAQNQPFDPNWHEAVSAVPHDGRGAAPGTVIRVLEQGYRLGDRLLRPARVIVAV
jgi:molecular chaperone GrpE